MMRSGFMIEKQLSFNIFSVTPSSPWALFGSIDVIIFKIL